MNCLQSFLAVSGDVFLQPSSAQLRLLERTVYQHRMCALHSPAAHAGEEVGC